MGGLVNYAMIVPGGIFTLLSLAFGLVHARKGSLVPLAITGVTYIVGLLAMVIVGLRATWPFLVGTRLHAYPVKGPF